MQIAFYKNFIVTKNYLKNDTLKILFIFHNVFLMGL